MIELSGVADPGTPEANKPSLEAFLAPGTTSAVVDFGVLATCKEHPNPLTVRVFALAS